jgi:hypothetical protein
MPRVLATIALALLGLLCAAGMGAAAYYVSRDSVGLPVTKLQPQGLAPAQVPRRPVRTTTTRATTPSTPTTTRPSGGDDHGGGSGGGGGRGRNHAEDD